MQITINRNGENYGPIRLSKYAKCSIQATQPTDMGHVEGESEWVPLSELSKNLSEAEEKLPVIGSQDSDTYTPTSEHEHEFRIECKPTLVISQYKYPLIKPQG